MSNKVAPVVDGTEEAAAPRPDNRSSTAEAMGVVASTLVVAESLRPAEPTAELSATSQAPAEQVVPPTAVEEVASANGGGGGVEEPASAAPSASSNAAAAQSVAATTAAAAATVDLSPDDAQRRTIADEAYARADEPLDLAGAQKILGPRLTEEEFRAMANDDGVVVRARVEMEQFTGVHALNAALENRSTVLVDGDWLLNFKGKSIPRRQDLPKKAIFSEQVQEPDNKDLKKTGQPMGFKNVVIIVVSYCWASREHPDPMGKHLAILKRVLAFMRSPKCAKEIGKKKILIFFDWMSLYQNHGGPPRTPEQDELFGLGLREVNLWYAHMWTFKLVLSELAPPNLERPTYLDSGWTSKFDRAVWMDCSTVR